jgi:hypothetical protein
MAIFAPPAIATDILTGVRTGFMIQSAAQFLVTGILVRACMPWTGLA